MKPEKTIIRKAATVSAQQISNDTLTKINTHTLRKMEEEDVFVFKLAMCDNEIDRVHEVFPEDTLRELASLFVGRTIIADHDRSTRNQCARIYDTQVVQRGERVATGEAYSQLVANCYMLRNSANSDIITDIEGGIKKEVSIGCRIGAAICSICGEDNTKTWCDHMPGKVYEGKQCHFRLEHAVDAYECSFVAVPAQPLAGVVKAYGAEQPADDAALEPPTGIAEKKIDGSQQAEHLELDLASAFLTVHQKQE